MTRHALISLSDKSGSEDLAKELAELGYQILSTSSTARHLREHGIEVREVSDLTGFPEILSGRVKTLHPRIHAGILADRSKQEHLQALREFDIEQIDVVVVNLYPFRQTLQRGDATPQEIIENIDIGGPALIRAAAKNHQGVLVLTDPEDYQPTLEQLRAGEVSLEWRTFLARKAFRLVSAYDALIASYFAGLAAETKGLPGTFSLHCRMDTRLRYGENPHQQGGFYLSAACPWQALHGKELSYNNHLDIDSTLRGLRLFRVPTVVITKHCNPCGIGSADRLADAWDKAFAADTQSPYGGIVGVNQPLDLETARRINSIFTEIILAPEYQPGVLELLRKKKNRRLIRFSPEILSRPQSPWELKNLSHGWLLQEWDPLADDPKSWTVVTSRQPSEQELKALGFAWKVVSLLRSNAIAITGADRVYGLGGGQTSRIDSTWLALHKAAKFGHDLTGAVCASDGFFPFRDSVDELQRHNIMAVIQPGGSKADPEVIQACNELGMAMIFTGVRHFRH
jgi:phosphoribosylaminoimidazolecarboxamide formyltransferase/IMP cyclohydrolase